MIRVSSINRFERKNIDLAAVSAFAILSKDNENLDDIILIVEG